MRLFRRLRRDGDRNDAGSTLRAGDAELRSLVALVAESLGYRCEPLDDESLLLSGPSRLRIGLVNLRQMAHQMPREEWPALVADHLGTLVTAAEHPLDIRDFDCVRHLVRTRVYPAGAANGRALYRELAPGLLEVLVADTPTTVRMIRRDETTDWPATVPELFALGYDNVRDDEPLEREDHDMEGVAVTLLHGDTFYAATHSLWLPDYVEVGEHGALVVLPTRHTLAVYPIRDDGAIMATEKLRTFAQRAYEDGPGSLSPELYWWRSGRLTHVKSRLSERSLDLFPTPEFVAMLETLGIE